MALTVCVGSFYLSFIFGVALSKVLFFAGIRLTKGKINDLATIMILFDVIVLLTLPLIMMMLKGVC